MNLKHIALVTVIAAGSVLSINAIRPKGEKDALHKRVFKVTQTEVKEGAPPKKPVEDEIEFKDGKVYSKFLNEKLEAKWIKYEITKDSLFNNEDADEVHWIEIEASTTDNTDQTIVITAKVEDFDIDGTVKVTKRDKLKKMFEFTGKEKSKK